MDPKLGEIRGGDIHVRDGVIVAVGQNLAAPKAEIVRADSMIALPGFIETHWHMWGAVARNMAGPTENTGYFYISRLLGQFFSPEDNARGVRLALLTVTRARRRLTRRYRSTTSRVCRSNGSAMPRISC